jgi:hypothetical protein
MPSRGKNSSVCTSRRIRRLLKRVKPANSREVATNNHELTRAKLAPVPVFQQPVRVLQSGSMLKPLQLTPECQR